MPSPFTSSATTSFTLSGVNNTDALLATTHVKWSGHALTFSFPWLNGASASWDYFNSYSSTNEPYVTPVSGFNSQQIVAATGALQAWCNVANITMTQVAETSTNVGDFRFGFSTAVDYAGPVWGWCYYPSSSASAADIWINPTVKSDSWAINSYNYLALLHEIGHGLGLKHPGDYNANGGGTDGPYIDASLDYRCYTIMSYNDLGYWFWDTTKNQFIGVNPETPMVYDIVAIQYLYGANNSYKTGNDTYTFNPAVPFYKTIWDAGGNDTIDVSTFSTNCTIDLTPGHYSSLHYTNSAGTGTAYYDGTNNLGIAFSCIIENATGGAGNDIIYGNIEATNILNGGGGNDQIWGYGGGDTLIGGDGNDVLQVSSDNNLLTGDNGNDSLIVNSGHNNILYGGEGNDILTAYSSGNILYGGNGNDRLNSYGSAGANTLVGGTGDDVYTVTNPGDIVTENANEGTDLVQVSIPTPKGSYTLPDNVENATIIPLMNNASPVEFTLIGNSLNNTLTGGQANCTLTGGAGIDTFVVISATASITDLGAGNVADILQISAGATAIATATGNFTATNGTVNNGTGSINANGHNVNLALAGGASGWTITNQSSSVVALRGSANNDIITGGSGNDTLTGGLGNDLLTGGAGSDKFVFSATPNANTNHDTVTDFVHGTDILQFTKSIFDKMVGWWNKDMFWSGAGVTDGHDSTDRIVYDTTSGNLYYDTDGSGGGAAVIVATIGITIHPTLTYSDIQLVV